MRKKVTLAGFNFDDAYGALMLYGQSDGRGINKAVYLAIGVNMNDIKKGPGKWTAKIEYDGSPLSSGFSRHTRDCPLGLLSNNQIVCSACRGDWNKNYCSGIGVICVVISEHGHSIGIKGYDCTCWHLD